MPYGRQGATLCRTLQLTIPFVFPLVSSMKMSNVSWRSFKWTPLFYLDKFQKTIEDGTSEKLALRTIHGMLVKRLGHHARNLKNSTLCSVQKHVYNTQLMSQIFPVSSWYLQVICFIDLQQRASYNTHSIVLAH